MAKTLPQTATHVRSSKVDLEEVGVCVGHRLGAHVGGAQKVAHPCCCLPPAVVYYCCGSQGLLPGSLLRLML